MVWLELQTRDIKSEFGSFNPPHLSKNAGAWKGRPKSFFFVDPKSVEILKLQKVSLSYQKLNCKNICFKIQIQNLDKTKNVYLLNKFK